MIRAVVGFAVIVCLVVGVAPRGSAADQGVVRWTDGTFDAMVDDAEARALAPTSAEHARLAALATLATLADRASGGRTAAALGRIARSTAATADVRDQAALLARAQSPDEGTPEGGRLDGALG
ncbi:MAG TPA: hypothetical protein VE987_11180, partial [Polyangiaceae bacterium]|nr:hypothetical protein [Polyangiaceae bacterium]